VTDEKAMAFSKCCSRTQTRATWRLLLLALSDRYCSASACPLFEA
jgi:hypothetical protein